MGKRRLYSEPLYALVDNATADYLEGRLVEPGEVLFVTHAALEDETSAPTTISFGRYVGQRFEGEEEDNAPQAGVRYHTEKTHHFVGGERPVWRVEGATLNDVLRGFMQGYFEEV